MRIGILGSGLMGAKLGTILARAGHEVVFSYARSEQKLRRLAREAGAKARAKVIVTCSLPMNEDNTALVVAHTWSGAEELAGWDSFYLIVGGAAGALIGLQFVVITLVAERPPEGAAEASAAFASPTVMHFSAVLVLAALLRAPWHGITIAAALLLLFTGIRNAWDAAAYHVLVHRADRAPAPRRTGL